jgi:hypothetical protein
MDYEDANRELDGKDRKRVADRCWIERQPTGGIVLRKHDAALFEWLPISSIRIHREPYNDRDMNAYRAFCPLRVIKHRFSQYRRDSWTLRNSLPNFSLVLNTPQNHVLPMYTYLTYHVTDGCTAMHSFNRIVLLKDINSHILGVHACCYLRNMVKDLFGRRLIFDDATRDAPRLSLQELVDAVYSMKYDNAVLWDCLKKSCIGSRHRPGTFDTESDLWAWVMRFHKPISWLYLPTPPKSNLRKAQWFSERLRDTDQINHPREDTLLNSLRHTLLQQFCLQEPFRTNWWADET